MVIVQQFVLNSLSLVLLLLDVQVLRAIIHFFGYRKVFTHFLSSGTDGQTNEASI